MDAKFTSYATGGHGARWPAITVLDGCVASLPQAFSTLGCARSFLIAARAFLGGYQVLLDGCARSYPKPAWYAAQECLAEMLPYLGAGAGSDWNDPAAGRMTRDVSR